MPRPKRIHYEGAVYHVTSSGNERRKIVVDDADRWMFIRLLGEMIEENKVVCHAWVLMDNHYHLLLETPEANLSLAMKHLNSCIPNDSTRTPSVGSFVPGRFKALVVEKESYLLEWCRYVVLNPVRARMVKAPGNWKWEQLSCDSRDRQGGEVAGDRLGSGSVWQVGERGAKELREFCKGWHKEKESPWEELSSQVYLGKEEFLNKVHELGRKHRHLDVPKYQKHVVKADPQEVLKKVGSVYGEKPEEILNQGEEKQRRERWPSIY